MSPTSTHIKSNGSDGSRSFSVQRQPEMNSSPEQEIPSYSRNAADALIANVMPSMEAREHLEEATEHKEQSKQGLLSVAEVVMPKPELPIVPAGLVAQSLGASGIQRQCSECQQEQEQGLEEGKDSDEMSLRVGIQTKLTVGAPGDKYEQEADRMAAQVMRMSVPATPLPQVQRFGEENNPVQMWSLARSITPIVHRRVDEQVQMRELVQRAFQSGGNQASGDLESRLNASKGGGSALSEEVRSFMEPRFGADFSAVRVHTGGEAVQMNRELGAQAFAHGSDIYFGAGKSPGNNELTAHELTHVVQQGAAPDIQHRSANENGETQIQSSEVRMGVADYVVQFWPGDGMSPPGDCGWATYAGLRGAVETAKAVVSTFGACSAGDNCLTLAAKIAAISAEIAARLALDTTCFKGGDTGHRQQVQDKINMMNRCYRFFSNSNCSPELIAAMEVVVERAREVIAAGAVVVASALVVALIAAIIALAEVIAGLVAAAAAATAEAAAVAAAVAAVIALLVLIKDEISSEDSSSA
ncbi:DUF4157 domain-containing protein [Cyanobacteria bacterium FACHB-472]|nr:DUF4157 domain-containing protein [Cyanobacteria bacterium FACHB-472]